MTGPSAALRDAAAVGALILGTLLALGIQLAPMGPAPDAPLPDLSWCVLAFFMLRRPDAAPLWLVFALLALRDALLGGPPGAGALTLLLALEALRLRARLLPAPRSLLGDWAAASLLYAAALAGQWLLMLISLADPPTLRALAPHALTTALAIPPVAAFLRYALRLGASPRERSA